MHTKNSVSRRKFLRTLLLASSAAAVDWTGFKTLASAIPNRNQIPIVVVGAGLGGLVAGAYLSKYGFDVTVIEQHAIPGGYATSFEREDFTFDVSLHATVAEHAMPQMILSDLGIWKELPVAYTPELRRIITPGFDVTLPAKNLEGVKQVLADKFPHERTGIYNFYAEMEQVIAELWRKKRFKKSMMAELESLTLEAWMSRHVQNPDVKYCLSIFCGYYGLPPEKLNALFYAIATGEYLVHGGQYFKTRSQDLSNTLANAVESNGGRIHYDTRVDQILFDSTATVEAVRDQHGTRYPARAVIANCSVPALVDKMVPADLMPTDYRKEVSQRHASLSSFIVWLGLDKNISGIRDYEIDIHSENGRYHDRQSAQEDLARADITVTIYDNLFADYSAPGKTTMSIMGLAEFDSWKVYARDYFDGNKAAYNLEKKRIAAHFIRRVEKALLPGLRDMIAVKEIGTPLTNLYYTRNPGGAIYGFDRDMPHLKARTPLPGLYLASAWSHGGGYTPVMMAGREAAGLALKDMLT